MGQGPQIGDYYKIMKEMDDVYASFQKHTGLSSAEYWCLVMVRTGECRYQHEISSCMYMSRQTINSALKQLMKKGYITLTAPEENRRVKEIRFTEQGESFAQRYLDPVEVLEERAWRTLSEEERRALTDGAKRLNLALSQELKAYMQTE